ncbi:MAG: peroxiredoxin [Solirubrobacterales bacterium]
MAKIDVGDKAPEFELAGTGEKTYRLSDYSKSGVILAFYPGDFTAVCTKQFCSYRDNADGIDGLGIPVLGISPQSVESHERWAEEQRLNVPLLADEDMKVAKAYGVTGWGSPLAWLAERKAVTPAGFFTQRAIFVVDGGGIVRYRQASFTGSTFQGVDELRQAVSALA